MYKFFGEPLKIIYSKTSNKPLFRFDTKGEFITDDNEIIQRAIGFFDHIELKAETVGDKVAKTVIIPETTIITEKQPKIDETKLKHCKKCDFTCENQGDLLAHYRTHKKEE